MSREFLSRSGTAYGVYPKLGPLFPYIIGEKSSLSQNWICKTQLTELRATLVEEGEMLKSGVCHKPQSPLVLTFPAVHSSTEEPQPVYLHESRTTIFAFKIIGLGAPFFFKKNIFKI